MNGTRYRCCEHCAQDIVHDVPTDGHDLPCDLKGCEQGKQVAPTPELPIHRTEAQHHRCATCDGGGCLDCTDPA